MNQRARALFTLAIGIGIACAFFCTSPTHAKSINMRTRPIDDLLGAPNFNIDADIGHAWTAGGGLALLTGSASGANNGAVLDATLVHYFARRSFESAWYLGPALYVVTTQVHVLGLDAHGSTALLGARGGYQWMWDVFNIQLGGVLLFASYYVDLGLDFSIGFAF